MDDHAFSAECLATAAALHDIRARLYKMMATGLPEGSMDNIRIILVEGHAVAKALERLATE